MSAEESRPPLTGIRVIAVEQFGAGPFATLQLADLGAEVIKIEDPASGGDVGRFIPPGQTGTDSLYFESFNRGKRSVLLDIKSAGGRRVFERLAASSDVVFNNLRGDLPFALGLTYESLGKLNPALVCVSLSAYGRTGFRSADPGYDALIQAEAGWAGLTGDPSHQPTKSGLSLVDYAAGLAASFAIVAGVLDARRAGHGRNLDVNLYDTAIALLTYPAAWFLSSGFRTERQPQSAHPSIVPFQFFETADGHVAVACAKERFFRLLAEGIGMPDLSTDVRFISFEARLSNRAELTALLNAQFRMRTTQDWLRRLRGRVPIAPVRSLDEALSIDELCERGLLAEYAHPVLGRVRTIGSPVRVGSFAPRYRAAPQLGADQTAVLLATGYSVEEIAALELEGAFGRRDQLGRKSV